MGKIIADILAAIGNFLNDFIGATLGKLIFVPMIKSMLGDGPGDPGFVNSLYNSMMIKANGFLQVSPDEWASGLGWQFINSIQDINEYLLLRNCIYLCTLFYMLHN